MRDLTIINFSHPLTEEQVGEIEALTGRQVERVIDVAVHLDLERPIAPQVTALVDKCGFSPAEWSTLPLLANLPGLAIAAAGILAEIHGRCGHFVNVVRLVRTDDVPPRWHVAEIICLQGIRDDARARRFQ